MTRKHVLLMILCCLIPVAALAAIFVFKIPATSVLIYGLVILCPVSHVVMMALMGRDHAAHDHASAPRPRAGARTEAGGE
ncbi:MAG TPA: hypothetical protein VJJ46_08230 [Anaerolineales bacterium]|nr:hypothetical protein [Anaerolineales bacterium]